MKIVFMGTPDFSVPVLKALVHAEHDIVAVYCQPPRPAGRGKKDRPSPIETSARDLGLPIRHPANFKSARDVADFVALQADVAIVVAYGLILPASLLEAPSFGGLNIHASLLPRWRGAAPIHRAIMAGDRETGICVMQMEQGLDTGPVLLRRKTAILATDTTGSLHDRLAQMGADAIVETLDHLATLTAIAQASDGVTYAAKISKDEARIDWNKSASAVDRKIRGLSPFPGAWCMANGERLKLLDSATAQGHGAPGEILSDDLNVACGDDAVRLRRLQRAGKTAQDAATFRRGFDLGVGDHLE